MVVKKELIGMILRQRTECLEWCDLATRTQCKEPASLRMCCNAFSYVSLVLSGVFPTRLHFRKPCERAGVAERGMAWRTPMLFQITSRE